MGCSGSSGDSHEPRNFRDKTLIWLLAGGPGAPKQQLAQILVERYKFRYLSAGDMVRFEENTGSPEAVEIRRCMDQRQQYPSELILKILKRIMSLYGPRKYLLEGFPRNQADVTALSGLSNQYDRVEVMGYINIEMTEHQMKDSGMRALKQLKKEESQQNLEKQVRAKIEQYRGKIHPVLEYYKSTSHFINQPWTNEDTYQMSMRIEQGLNKQGVSPVLGVPIHFLLGNDPKQIKQFGIKLSKRFGMLAWGLDELVHEAKKRPEFKKETEKALGQISEQFIAQLIVRKIDKNNYCGPFLFWGFPRKEEDMQALRVILLQELSFVTFNCCIHTPTTQNEEALYQKLKKHFSETQQSKCVLVNSGENAYSQIQANIANTVHLHPCQGRLVVIPVIGDEGTTSPLAKMPECEYVQFKQLLRKQIEEKHLYSDLIASNQTLNRPLPPPLAVSIVIKNLRESSARQQSNLNQESERPYVVRGYPQNVEQLKALYARSPELKGLGAIIFQNAKGNEDELAEHKEIESSLECACSAFFKFSQKTATEECKYALAKVNSL